MTHWRSFWEGHSPFPLSTWDWQTELFLQQSRELFSIGEGDTVLDLGCGPGALAFALAQGRSPAAYYGLDVSASAIAQARERMTGNPLAHHFHFATLGEDYLDLQAVLPTQSPVTRPLFTRLLALSVVQYYQSRAELQRLIEVMRNLAAPRAILLIADLPLRQRASAVAETLSSLKAAKAAGGLIKQITFLTRCALSPYRHARQKAGLLTFTHEELNTLASNCDRRYGSKSEVLILPLTVSQGRAHMRIVFP